MAKCNTWGKVGSCCEYHRELQGAGAPKCTAQAPFNAQIETGSGCEV